MQDLIGKQLDQYRVDMLLGQGGLGVVYRAFDGHLSRLAALKVAHAHLSAERAFPEQFLARARAAARLKHPSVAEVYDFGASDGLCYVVNTYVNGGSLSSYLAALQRAGKVLDLRAALLVMAQVADALAFAHAQGVVHQAIKPQNILLEIEEAAPENDGSGVRAVVTDFGLSQVLDGAPRSTVREPGAMGYLSPEQCLGADVDGRADIYSLGVVLYQLTTGRLPFAIHSPTEAVVKHMKETPPPAVTVNPNLPAKVDAIIRKAIAKQADERFADGTLMARALRAAAAGLTPTDLTRFAGGGTVAQLPTTMAPPAVADNARLAGGPPVPTGRYFATVSTPDGVSQRVFLQGLVLIAGRGADCELLLDAAGVSRHHLRLERTISGWQVVDLGSTNGTFIEKNRLLAGVAEPWETGAVLRAGPFSIYWQQAETPDVADAGAPPGGPALSGRMTTPSLLT